ncbi:hypothetical protein GCM10023318_11780 [Nocardia callitridis]|uniref:Uncharacterized protein n=1 Tax=Nocardia callitridis TaxID=648753 RepID=A0ABP9JWK8_9NOCA
MRRIGRVLAECGLARPHRTVPVRIVGLWEMRRIGRVPVLVGRLGSVRGPVRGVGWTGVRRIGLVWVLVDRLEADRVRVRGVGLLGVRRIGRDPVGRLDSRRVRVRGVGWTGVRRIGRVWVLVDRLEADRVRVRGVGLSGVRPIDQVRGAAGLLDAPGLVGGERSGARRKGLVRGGIGPRGSCRAAAGSPEAAPVRDGALGRPG